jgi:ribonuclease PH
MLDLCYEEDSTAEVDANIVMNDRGEFIEVQATAEGLAFPRHRLEELLDLAEKGIHELLSIQRQVMLES